MACTGVRRLTFNNDEPHRRIGWGSSSYLVAAACLTGMSSEILDHLTATLRAEAAFDMWDSPPSLALLTTAPEGTISSLAVQFPADLWVGQPVNLVLDVLTAAVLQGHPLPVSANAPDSHVVFGVILFAETWSVDFAGATDTEFEELEAAATAGRLADHPRAKETKNLTCVTVTGDRYAATLDRNSDTVSVFEGDQVVGSVSDRLFGLLAAQMIAAL